jgi:hypothetical protein
MRTSHARDQTDGEKPQKTLMGEEGKGYITDIPIASFDFVL